MQPGNHEPDKQIKELEDVDIIVMVRERGLTMEKFAGLLSDTAAPVCDADFLTLILTLNTGEGMPGKRIKQGSFQSFYAHNRAELNIFFEERQSHSNSNLSFHARKSLGI